VTINDHYRVVRCKHVDLALVMGSGPQAERETIPTTETKALLRTQWKAGMPIALSHSSVALDCRKFFFIEKCQKYAR